MNDDFDKFAENYNDILNNAVHLSGEEAEFFIETKIKLMHDEINRNHFRVRSILDFGCGTGNALKHIRKYFPESNYYGIDVSEQSIQHAMRQEDADHFLQYDSKQLPFENYSFDIVFASVVFHHIPFESHVPLLEDICRVLKKKRFFLPF